MSLPETTTAAHPAETARPASVRRPGLVLAFLCIAQFMVFLDVSIVNVALPSIKTSLDISAASLPYVVTAYGTLLGGFLLLGSRLADTFGRRRLLRIGLAGFGTASLIAGLSTDPIMLFLARGAQGLGSAMIAPAALSTLTATFAEGPARAKALGVWGALTGVASVAGVIFGGLLAQGPGWRWIFFINVPIAAVAVALAPSILPESRGTRAPRFDAQGAVSLTAALLLLIYTLDEGNAAGWGSARTLGGLIGVAVLLAAFGAIEARAGSPLVPFSIFRRTSLRAANAATVLLLGSVVTLFYFTSLFMQQVLHYSAIKAGMAYVPLAVTVAVAAGVASGLATKVAVKAVLTAGLVLVTGGLLMLSQLPAHAHYAADVLPAFLVIGLGLGLSFVPLQIAAQMGVSDTDAGLAAGLINTSQEVGGALGVAVAASVAFSQVGNAARSFHHAFLVGAGFAAGALLLALILLPFQRASASTPAG